MDSKIPGVVVRIHGKDHEDVDVQFKDQTVSVKNHFLKHLKVGDYVTVSNDMVLQILTEHQAEKLMK